MSKNGDSDSKNEEVISNTAKYSSPLKEFMTAGMLKTTPKKKEVSLLSQTNKHLSVLSPIAKEFLAIQAEMLVYSKVVAAFVEHNVAADTELVRWKRQFDGRSAEGVILLEKPIMKIQNGSRIRMDCYDSDKQIISLSPTNTFRHPLGTKIDSTLSHEMTHAIDDIYFDRKSGDNVLEVLRAPRAADVPPGEYQKRVVLEAVRIIDPLADGVFKTLYCNPSIDGPEALVTACDNAEQVEKSSQTSQQNAASRLLIEFASFSIENIFEDIKTQGNANNFINRYNEQLREEGTSGAAAGGAGVDNSNLTINQAAQELVAVAINDVIESMQTHIRERPERLNSMLSALSEESKLHRQSISGVLSRVQETIAPAFSRAHLALENAQARIEERQKQAVAEVSAQGETIAPVEQSSKKRRTEAPRQHGGQINSDSPERLNGRSASTIKLVDGMRLNFAAAVLKLKNDRSATLNSRVNTARKDHTR